MDDFAHMPALLERAFALPRSAGRMAICRGNVKVDGVTIGHPSMDIPRAELAGVDIAYKEKVITVAADGRSFKHRRVGRIRDGADNRLF